MPSKNFFAIISRMKYINRWVLMRNTHPESLSQHSHEVAVIAHALALISNKKFGTAIDAERAALIGLYHDCTEILTGDMPTPVKYHSPEIRSAFRAVEDTAAKKLLNMLPDYLRDDYSGLLFKKDGESDIWKIVKAADKISALIKCIEEEKAGNTEFTKAAQSIRRIIEEMDVPAANVFIEEFLPGYSLTLDQLD